MSYNTIAAMAQDLDLKLRVTACAAAEGTASPQWWGDQHIWQVVSDPGWSEAYQYALDTGNEFPGRDEAVITDGMILASVQPMLAEPPTE